VADRLIIKGARRHKPAQYSIELHAIDDRRQGLSGSGKSRWRSDTIFAEAGPLRRVVVGVGPQFARPDDKPDVASSKACSPAVSIDQKSTNRTPRSTVGTITEGVRLLRMSMPGPAPRTARCAVSGSPSDPAADRRPGVAMDEAPGFRVLAPWCGPARASSSTCSTSSNSQGLQTRPVDGGALADRPAEAKEAESTTSRWVVDR